MKDEDVTLVLGTRFDIRRDVRLLVSELPRRTTVDPKRRKRIEERMRAREESDPLMRRLRARIDELHRQIAERDRQPERRESS
jgi:hypothetical protein